MKPKTKDGTKLNLYVDRSIVRILDELSRQQGLSRSVIVERLVRSDVSSTDKRSLLSAAESRLKDDHGVGKPIVPKVPPSRKSRQEKAR